MRFFAPCALLAALFAAPALGQVCNCPQQNTTTTPPPPPPQQQSYITTAVSLQIQKIVQNLPCDTYRILYELIFQFFMYENKQNGYTMQKEIIIDIYALQNSVLTGSTFNGLTVNIWVAPKGTVVISVEYIDVFVQITITQSNVVVLLSLQTVDGCSCGVVSYDTVLVSSDYAPPPSDYTDDYAYYNDYSDGAENSDYGCNQTTAQQPCSVCGGYTTAAPPPPSGGCNCQS